MRRRLLLPLAALVLAAVAAEPSTAATRTLWPGVTYERGVQFTTRGPVAINVLRGPRPGGLTTLEPVLSNETIVGRETLTSMQRRLAPAATAAGVNGDYFTLATGRPSGVLMRDGQLINPPNGRRASAGVTTAGALDVRRVSLAGTWRTGVQAHPLGALNQPPSANGVALYTQAYGGATPAVPGGFAVILFPFPVATPDIDLVAPVVEVLPAATPVPIPIGGAVLVGRGTGATTLQTESPVGATAVVRLTLRPAWPGVVAAIGGGPQIVRGGAPVFSAGEAFTTRQLGPAAPRTGVGQLRDGRIVLVAVDGRQPGYSTGLTNFELAQALVRLGAVTGMALDSGGSTTMAFDGTLLNRPSDGRERAVSTALMLLYRGVFAPEPPARVSPNGDGVADTPDLRYRLPRASSVTVTLRAPDGSTPVTTTADQGPGTYPVRFPDAGDAAAAEAGDTAAPAAAGSWTFEVKAVDDLGQASTMTRTFVVDDTLGFLRVPARAAVPSSGRSIRIAWRLFRPARTFVTVHDAAGRVVRRGLAPTTQLEPGDQAVTWDGLGDGRKRLAGAYTVRVVARSSLGSSTLDAPITLRLAR
jgi:Phosphodiester glycosidase/FlgD Ig-like domain